MKNYLLVRWRNRWEFIFIGAAGVIICVSHSYAVHDGKAGHCIPFMIGFTLLGILFPFRWGGEEWDEDRRDPGRHRR